MAVMGFVVAYIPENKVLKVGESFKVVVEAMTNEHGVATILSSFFTGERTVNGSEVGERTLYGAHEGIDDHPS